LTELEKLRIVAGYEFLKHIRRRRLYIILALTVVAELLVLILVPVLRDGYPDNIVVMAALLTIGPALATFGAIFFAGDAIAGEFENKTGFILFTNPVGRMTLVIGKYLACCAAVILLVILGYVIVCISLLAIYGSVPFETLGSFGLALLYTASVLSVTFFFSSISKGSMGATVITLVFIMVICGIIESVLSFTGNPYWFILSAGGDSMTVIYGDMEALMAGLGLGDVGGGMMGFEPMNIGLTAWGMVIYLVVGFLASLWITKRRQLA
jgi:ABC-type transport system involved in multi-copper enzyme maturation permease subunit